MPPWQQSFWLQKRSAEDWPSSRKSMYVPVSWCLVLVGSQHLGYFLELEELLQDTAIKKREATWLYTPILCWNYRPSWTFPESTVTGLKASNRYGFTVFSMHIAYFSIRATIFSL